MRYPKISVIVCTYNAPSLIKRCLESILSQNYPNFEVLCVDGMSGKKTLEVVKSFVKKDNRVKLIENRKRLAEGYGNGKWIGYQKSDGEIFGIIDQDNLIQDSSLFMKVFQIFNREDKIAGVLAGLKYDERDEEIVRFVSLFGTDPFFAYRSIDYLRNFLKEIMTIRKTDFLYEIIHLSPDNLFLTGGNCFFYKRKDLQLVGGYKQDILSIQHLVKSGKNQLGVIPEATKHFTEKNIYRLIKKITFGKKYFKLDEERFDYLPKTPLERNAFFKNIVFSALIVPRIFEIFGNLKIKKDKVMIYFPFLAFIATFSYALVFIRQKLKL